MKTDWKSDFVCHWKYYTTPARPSLSDLEFIKEKIKEIGNAKVLILGATPEYRDLCSELGVKVTLIDFSRKNYEYLTDEVKLKPEEIFFEGNWITTILDEKFDIILADNVINVIKKEDAGKLLSNVSKMLKPGGLFLPRTYIRDKSERYTPEGIIKKYREGGNKKPMFSWTVRDIVVSAYNFEEDNAVFKDVGANMELLFQKGLITEEEYEDYKNLSFHDREFNFYIPLREEFDSLLASFFKLEGIFHGKEAHLKKQLPIHVLKIKN